MAALSIQSSSNPIITEHLLLRPLSPNDGDAVFEIRSDPKVFWWRNPDTRGQSDEWLKDRLESHSSLAYTVSVLPNTDSNTSLSISDQLRTAIMENPKVIGMTGAHALPEIGYVFLPNAWGKGYATEALRAWIDMYWTRWPDGWDGLPEEKRSYLNAITGPGGDSSTRVLKKCGFKGYGSKVVIEEKYGSKDEDHEVVLSEFRLQKPIKGK